MLPKLKMHVAIIAVILAFSTALAEPSDSTKQTKENFTSFERIANGYLNSIVPGLGSVAIMSDWTGAAVQWVLFSGGIGLMVAGYYNDEEKCSTYALFDDPNSRVEKCSTNMTKVGDNLLIAGLITFLSSYVYNVYRSITYNKPGSVAHSKYGDFNVAVLPNRHGNFNTYLMYNKAF
jgi:hypothetical protein